MGVGQREFFVGPGPRKIRLVKGPKRQNSHIEHNPTVGGHLECSSSTKYPASERSEKNKNSIFEKTNLIQ
jgi:hypothetical protein